MPPRIFSRDMEVNFINICHMVFEVSGGQSRTRDHKLQIACTLMNDMCKERNWPRLSLVNCRHKLDSLRKKAKHLYAAMRIGSQSGKCVVDPEEVKEAVSKWDNFALWNSCFLNSPHLGARLALNGASPPPVSSPPPSPQQHSAPLFTIDLDQECALPAFSHSAASSSQCSTSVLQSASVSRSVLAPRSASTLVTRSASTAAQRSASPALPRSAARISASASVTHPATTAVLYPASTPAPLSASTPRCGSCSETLPSASASVSYSAPSQSLLGRSMTGHLAELGPFDGADVDNDRDQVQSVYDENYDNDDDGGGDSAADMVPIPTMQCPTAQHQSFSQPINEQGTVTANQTTPATRFEQQIVRSTPTEANFAIRQLELEFEERRGRDQRKWTEEMEQRRREHEARLEREREDRQDRRLQEREEREERRRKAREDREDRRLQEREDREDRRARARIEHESQLRRQEVEHGAQISQRCGNERANASGDAGSS
eukprot:scpid94687/ scgid17154/ 